MSLQAQAQVQPRYSPGTELLQHCYSPATALQLQHCCLATALLQHCYSPATALLQAQAQAQAQAESVHGGWAGWAGLGWAGWAGWAGP